MTIPMSTPYFKSRCLLEDIATKRGCIYLSDLVCTIQDYRIKSVSHSLNPDNYSMKEWIDTSEYLTREPQSPFVSRFEAAQYLFSRPSYYKYIEKKF